MSRKTYQGDGVDVSFDGKLCIHARECVTGLPRVFQANAPGRWIHPDEASPEQIAALAQSCPSGAIAYNRKDGGPDGRGVGFYFCNVTEIVLFGVRGQLRTLAPGRRQVNVIPSRKREHSRKPDELYDIIESCSPGPHLELFARGERENWNQWGNESKEYQIGGKLTQIIPKRASCHLVISNS